MAFFPQLPKVSSLYFIIVIFVCFAYYTGGTVYLQTAYFEQPDCQEQPFYIYSTALVTNDCSTIGVAQNTCTETPNSSGAYSNLQTCNNANDTLDLTGRVEVYVAVTSYVGSTTCDPSTAITVEAAFADALCHQQIGGSPNSTASFLSVNCNGGAPIWQDCSEPYCLNCTQTNYSGTCDVTGASSSLIAVCIDPRVPSTGSTSSGSSNSTGSNIFNDSSRRYTNSGIFYSVLVAVLLMFFSLPKFISL